MAVSVDGLAMPKTAKSEFVRVETGFARIMDADLFSCQLRWLHRRGCPSEGFAQEGGEVLWLCPG